MDSCVRKNVRTCLILLIIATILFLCAYYRGIVQRVIQEANKTSFFSQKVNGTQTQDAYERKFPSAIIIGVKKGGTKALISMLNTHPNIKAAKGEVHFFDRITNYAEGLRWYIKKMPLTTSAEMAIEKSPSYFVVPEVPQRIAKYSKDVKLILIVRDPITRLISDYTQLYTKKVRRGITACKFEDYIFKPDGSISMKLNMVKVSMYDVHFKRWLEYFSRNQIFIVDGDQLIQNPLKEITKVEEFLNVPKYFTTDMFYFNKTKQFYCWKGTQVAAKCLGSNKGRKHPEISNSSLETLKDFYKPHMASFCSMANLNFKLCIL